MESELSRMWWVLALRGVLAILFGVVAFFWPGLAWMIVVYTFAAYALMDGIFALGILIAGLARPGRWWALLLEGVAGITFGLLTFFWPIAAVVDMWMLLFFVAGWLIATGVFEAIGAIQLRRYIRGEWLLILSGILSILLGVSLAVFPVAGLWVMAVWVGAYSLTFGVLMLALAFRLRALGRAPMRSTGVFPAT